MSELGQMGPTDAVPLYEDSQADILTKGLGKQQHTELRSALTGF